MACRWAHEICSDDNEERAIVTGSMNQMAYVVQIWLPLLIWQQIDAPMYSKGFTTVLFLSVAILPMTGVRWWLRRQEFKQEVLQIRHFSKFHKVDHFPCIIDDWLPHTLVKRMLTRSWMTKKFITN